VTLFGLTLGILLALASPSIADVLLTRIRNADEFIFESRVSPGAVNQKVEIWIGSDRIRRDDGKTALILRLDQKKLYLVNHAEKTYAATDLRQEGGRWLATATFVSSGPDKDVWTLHAKVEPTGETRKIGSWQAAKHRVVLSNEAGTGNRLRVDWWIDPDLKVEDAALRTLMRLLASFGPTGDEWLATVLAVPGHPVLYERVEKQPEVDVKIREELKSIKEGEAPMGTYDPPAGYRLMDLGDYRNAYGWPSPL
jgi:hypothetical protein